MSMQEGGSCCIVLVMTVAGEVSHRVRGFGHVTRRGSEVKDAAADPGCI